MFCLIKQLHHANNSRVLNGMTGKSNLGDGIRRKNEQSMRANKQTKSNEWKEKIVKAIKKNTADYQQENAKQYIRLQDTNQEKMSKTLSIFLRKNKIPSDVIKLLGNMYPYIKNGIVPFLAESKNHGKNKNVSLACISEMFLGNCYEKGPMGFSSLVIATLDHLRLCYRNKGAPSIRWRNCFGGCKPNPEIDSFPFYFKPLYVGIENKAKTVLCLGASIVNYHNMPSKILRPNNWVTNSGQKVYEERIQPVLDFSFRERPGLTDAYSPDDLITEKLRHEMNFIIEKYLKVNPSIMTKVGTFFSKSMKNYNILGIHVRGTDHWMESANLKLPKVSQWVDEADEILQRLAAPKKIFVASDNEETIQRFIEHFGKEKVSFLVRDYL